MEQLFKRMQEDFDLVIGKMDENIRASAELVREQERQNKITASLIETGKYHFGV